VDEADVDGDLLLLFAYIGIPVGIFGAYFFSDLFGVLYFIGDVLKWLITIVLGIFLWLAVYGHLFTAAQSRRSRLAAHESAMRAAVRCQFCGAEEAVMHNVEREILSSHDEIQTVPKESISWVPNPNFGRPTYPGSTNFDYTRKVSVSTYYSEQVKVRVTSGFRIHCCKVCGKRWKEEFLDTTSY